MQVLEILIYDDGSPDNTPQILRQLEEDNDKIIVKYGRENRGAGYARSELLQLARGQYVAFLDADDEWFGDKLAIQLSAMISANAKLSTAGYEVYNSDGTFLGVRKPPKIIKFWSMHFANWIATSMTIVNRDLEGFTDMPLIRKRQDYAYWLKLFKLNPGLECLSISTVLGRYHRLDSGLSASPIDNLKANYHMYAKVLNYGLFTAGLFVLCNAVIRILRT